ncbi:MAG: hypothetical protein ACTHKL_23445 [Streptosporangiaceae bacterium]
MAVWAWILIVIAAVIVVAVIAARKRRTEMLRQRFGPEYGRTVQASKDRRAAEAELRSREKQREQFDIKPLPEDTRLRFADEWREVQEQFVDEPSRAVADADAFITRVMQARGYPMKDFEAQADMVSVDHPDVVENYRSGHAIWQRSQGGQGRQASTEELREALLRYRSLADELLRPEATETAAAGRGAAGISGTAPGYASDTDTPSGRPGAATATPDGAGAETGPDYRDEAAPGSRR